MKSMQTHEEILSQAIEIINSRLEFNKDLYKLALQANFSSDAEVKEFATYTVLSLMIQMLPQTESAISKITNKASMCIDKMIDALRQDIDVLKEHKAELESLQEQELTNSHITAGIEKLHYQYFAHFLLLKSDKTYEQNRLMRTFINKGSGNKQFMSQRKHALDSIDSFMSEYVTYEELASVLLVATSDTYQLAIEKNIITFEVSGDTVKVCYSPKLLMQEKWSKKWVNFVKYHNNNNNKKTHSDKLSASLLAKIGVYSDFLLALERAKTLASFEDMILHFRALLGQYNKLRVALETAKKIFQQIEENQKVKTPIAVMTENKEPGTDTRLEDQSETLEAPSSTLPYNVNELRHLDKQTEELIKEAHSGDTQEEKRPELGASATEFVNYYQLRQANNTSFATEDKQQPNSNSDTFKQNLIKNCLADSFLQLFSESPCFPQKISFKELCQIIQICGGQIQKIGKTGSSRRRIVFQNQYTETWETKGGFHAPHGSRTKGDPLEKIIIQQFTKALQRANITPEALGLRQSLETELDKVSIRRSPS